MKKDLIKMNKRFYYIRKLLEEEATPMNLPSRDHSRTNRNGVNIE
jgi:hypothetical protein